MNSWFVKEAVNYALGRLREPSTWAAIAASLAASLHLHFSDTFTNAFIGAGLALSALLAIGLKEGVK